MVNLCFFFSYLHLIASQVTRMKKATVHIFSPLHMSIILEMSMAKPALHKDEPTPSPMRKSVSLKKNKQKPKRNKQRGLKALVPHCVGIRHIPSWLFFFCFQSASRLNFCACLCWNCFIPDSSSLLDTDHILPVGSKMKILSTPKSWFNSLPTPNPSSKWRSQRKKIKK